jgi:hypothetical protein
LGLGIFEENFLLVLDFVSFEEDFGFDFVLGGLSDDGIFFMLLLLALPRTET